MRGKYKINVFEAICLFMTLFLFGISIIIYRFRYTIDTFYINMKPPYIITAIIVFGILSLLELLSIFDRMEIRYISHNMKIHMKIIYKMLKYKFKDSDKETNPKVNIPIAIHKRFDIWSSELISIKQFPIVKNLKDQIRYKSTDKIKYDKRTFRIYKRALKEPELYNQTISSDIWFMCARINNKKYFTYITDKGDIIYLPVNKVRHIIVPDTEWAGQILKYDIRNSFRNGATIKDEIYFVLIPASKIAYTSEVYKNTTHYICTKNEYAFNKQFIIGEEYINTKLLK